MAKWEFDIRRDGSGVGLEEPATKLFKDNPINNLVRETVQIP